MSIPHFSDNILALVSISNQIFDAPKCFKGNSIVGKRSISEVFIKKEKKKKHSKVPYVSRVLGVIIFNIFL